MIYTDGIIIAADTFKELQSFHKHKRRLCNPGGIEDIGVAVFLHVSGKYAYKLNKAKDIVITSSKEVMVKAKLCKYKHLTKQDDV